MSLSIDQCRKILGKRAEGMTDEEIIQLHSALCGIANTLIDKFLFDRSETNSERSE